MGFLTFNPPSRHHSGRDSDVQVIIAAHTGGHGQGGQEQTQEQAQEQDQANQLARRNALLWRLVNCLFPSWYKTTGAEFPRSQTQAQWTQLGRNHSLSCVVIKPCCMPSCLRARPAARNTQQPTPPEFLTGMERVLFPLSLPLSFISHGAAEAK